MGCVPPATAERAKQRRGVGEALDVGLHLGEGGVLVLLLGRQYLELRVLAGAILLERELAVGARGAQGDAVRRIALAVVLQRLQGVGNFDEGGNDGRVVARERLPVALFGLVLPRGECAAVKERRGQIQAPRPDRPRSGEEVRQRRALLRVLRRDAKRREARRLS